MSGTAASQDADFLLESRGVSRDLGAWVVGAAWERGGTAAPAASASATARCAWRAGGGACRGVDDRRGA